MVRPSERSSYRAWTILPCSKKRDPQTYLDYPSTSDLTEIKHGLLISAMNLLPNAHHPFTSPLALTRLVLGEPFVCRTLLNAGPLASQWHDGV